MRRSPLLLIALILGAVGYAEGGRLAREMPGWRVICWVVVLALPLSLPLTVMSGIISPPHPDVRECLAPLYLASVTMFLGFFAWYSGLARAGSHQQSQLQLAQPFLTIGIAALVLGERPACRHVRRRQPSCWHASWPLSARGSGAMGCDRRRLGCH